MEERYNLAIDRMKAIIEEKTVAEPYREYFQHVARFILKLDELKQNVESGKQKEMSEEELQEEMKDLYADELEANYEKSYANPALCGFGAGRRTGMLFVCGLHRDSRKHFLCSGTAYGVCCDRSRAFDRNLQQI